MEQNKAFFRLMLFISAVLTVAGMVLLILRGEGIGMMLSLLAINALFCGGLALGIAHPEWNVKYGLHREEGRLRWGRVPYAPDPEGLRYRYYSILMPLFTLLMGGLMVTEGDTDTLEGWNMVLLILFCTVTGAAIGYVEYKLRKEQ